MWAFPQQIAALQWLQKAEGLAHVASNLYGRARLCQVAAGPRPLQPRWAVSRRGHMALSMPSREYPAHPGVLPPFMQNILLTREFSAKIADVGLARVLSCTHHSLGDETMGT